MPKLNSEEIKKVVAKSAHELNKNGTYWNGCVDCDIDPNHEEHHPRGVYNIYNNGKLLLTKHWKRDWKTRICSIKEDNDRGLEKENFIPKKLSSIPGKNEIIVDPKTGWLEILSDRYFDYDEEILGDISLWSEKCILRHFVCDLFYDEDTLDCTVMTDEKDEQIIALLWHSD